MYADAEQEKHSHTMQMIEENIRTVTRAIRRMLWWMLGGTFVLWANNVISDLVPPDLSVFGAKIAGCILIGSGISLLAFTAYRILALRRLEHHRQQCRALLEAALGFRAVSDAALRLQGYTHGELQCSRCGMALSIPAPEPARIATSILGQRQIAAIGTDNGPAGQSRVSDFK
jgi:uncharacterized membrane protein YcjF (UPF0283 family)